MRWLIGTIIIVTSSLLGLFTSYATVNNMLPGNIRTINPKPEANIIGIDESNDSLKLLTSGAETETLSEEDQNYTEEEKPYRLFLLMGTDVVYSGHGRKTQSLQGRTDSIIIAKLAGDKLDLLSIPRDSRVYIPGYGFDKINAANVYGGPELVLKTIENWLKIHIEDYAMINTYGVVQFVDLFGGVNFKIQQRMYYTDRTARLYIDLYPGWQHLDGLKVHNFLRFRHDGMGDLNRVKRQQEIIKAMVPQILKPLNLLKIPSAIKVINNNIDTNLSNGKLLFLAKKALEIKDLQQNITMHTLPGTGGMYHGGWYWMVNEKESQKIISDLGILNTGNATELVQEPVTEQIPDSTEDSENQDVPAVSQDSDLDKIE